MAVFLGGWTWLYTYRADAWKFWTLVPAGFVINLSLNFALPGLGTVTGVLMAIWPIVDVSVKTREFYDTYWERFPRK